MYNDFNVIKISYDTNVTHYSEILSVQGFQMHSTIEWG